MSATGGCHTSRSTESTARPRFAGLTSTSPSRPTPRSPSCELALLERQRALALRTAGSSWPGGMSAPIVLPGCRSQAVPGRIGRGAGSAAGDRAGHRPASAEAAGNPRGAPAPRRARLDARGRAAAESRGRRRHPDRRQSFETDGRRGRRGDPASGGLGQSPHRLQRSLSRCRSPSVPKRSRSPIHRTRTSCGRTRHARPEPADRRASRPRTSRTRTCRARTRPPQRRRERAPGATARVSAGPSVPRPSRQSAAGCTGSATPSCDRRPRDRPVQRRGRRRRHPQDGSADRRGEPCVERRPGPDHVVPQPGHRPAPELARQARADRVRAGRLGVPDRRDPSGRPRGSRPRGVQDRRCGSSTPGRCSRSSRRARAAATASSSASARASGCSRFGAARTVLPVAVVDSDRMWPRGHLLPRSGKHVTVRYGAPFNVADELRASAGPGEGQGGHRGRHAPDHGPDRRAAPAAPARRLQRTSSTSPRPWRRVRTGSSCGYLFRHERSESARSPRSGSRSGRASATASARPSTRPRRPARPASRRTPSARSSTTRA